MKQTQTGPSLCRPTREFELHYSDARTERFASAQAFVAATLEAVRTQATVKSVYAFWEANLDSFAALLRAEQRGDDNPMQVIGSALKERIRTLAHGERNGDGRGDAEANRTVRTSSGDFQKGIPQRAHRRSAGRSSGQPL